MTTETIHETTTSAEVGGIGHSIRRKEDERFVQGAGRYVDDVVLPGMLHLALLRSPVPHARIVSIDTSAASAVEGVVAVLTGRELEGYNLAWMPTLSGDTQAVLATDKVRFQGQEVAAVIAESPYIAYDALDLIDVEFDALPPVLNPQQALADGAPVIRDDKEGQTDNACYTWESGDQDATGRAFEAADVVVKLDTHYPRSHPAPLETCACVADVNPATKHVTIYMTSQAPHAHRTLFAMVAGLPEQNIRIVSPDLGGACAQLAVTREAASALRDGRTRLLLLGVPAEAAAAFDEGVVVVPMACGSEGALAVSLEPVVPAPLVVAVGDSPAVATLVSLARDLGWRGVEVASADEIARPGIDAGAAVVVATQGHDDEAAVVAALATDAGYVGLVASRKRAEATLGYLRDRGVPEADLARVQAPAGLDLGSTDHREIAVAVLAELVARRAAGLLRPPVAEPAPSAATEAIDRSAA